MHSFALHVDKEGCHVMARQFTSLVIKVSSTVQVEILTSVGLSDDIVSSEFRKSCS